MTTVLLAFGVPQVTTEQVTAIIAATSTMVAYILGEGLVDAVRAKEKGDENTL